MAIDPRDFRDAVGRFPTGVTVLTAEADGVLHGMTANAFASVSLDPLLVLVCVDRGAGMHDFLSSAGGFAVNILGVDQEEVSTWFASPRRPAGTDQFDETPFVPAPITRSPLIEGAIVTLDCVLHATYDGGDHSIFIGEVVGLTEHPGEPLLWHQGDYTRPEQ